MGSLGRAIAASAACFLVAAFVAVREWSYHQGHRFRPGPSLELAALGVAVAVLACVVLWLLSREEHRTHE